MCTERPVVLSLQQRLAIRTPGELMWHTMNKLDILTDISTPATQVVVHAHSHDKEILICVKINTGEGIEVRIAEYDVALGSSQPGAGL